MRPWEYLFLTVFSIVVAASLLAAFGHFSSQPKEVGDFTIIPTKGGYMIAVETTMPEAELRARVHNMLHPELQMVIPEITEED